MPFSFDKPPLELYNFPPFFPQTALHVERNVFFFPPPQKLAKIDARSLTPLGVSTSQLARL